MTAPRLDGRTALVTGASRGIGAATARALDRAGARVVLTGRNRGDTALWTRNKEIPGVVETIKQQTPLRRWAHPDDIADVIAFLASDAARFITGETISVDGGMARTLDLYGGAV